ncbi:dehydroquinase class I [Methanoregula boonei 6A8]|jgi:3-dehydroquinate dehydratase-1|uniref:3-dehydroquinate dehydratase n=1 Tax=Methanoregula boonei (strain DSM 21154 / JCM 14090 / 6A8) TaxID=456442 RepID=AROD_METB6|nr:type I 3-dehydroquinate dehydratase [Methanoregula boonei]A7I8M6.1 RecName: Full=3-dehydroquinate dehydratase; Short=3-dehydroquinase; AltName: Full=Type I DHQase; AltName: Full=Type I dehydroquinase; Short=DHQ1 [Methanoregula boonei 6A8]ABS56087.1 dehydroquinase class I [Methanoregula boonei 6A8]
MQIVASLTDPSQAATAQSQGADLLELRFDLMEGDPVDIARRCRAISKLPLIATFRSALEGGRYFGSPEEWAKKIAPVLPLVDYVDIEQQFARKSGLVREAGKAIIASHHTAEMLPLHVLFVLEQELRAYGDIPKIIVTPHNEDELIDLIAFTRAAKKPVCTGVMGSAFRYARAILPLFGSELAYCHAGVPAAEGQYSVAEFVALMKMLS